MRNMHKIKKLKFLATSSPAESALSARIDCEAAKRDDGHITYFLFISIVGCATFVTL
jgi:hypothetical protein